MMFKKIKEFCSNHYCDECPFEKDNYCIICNCYPIEWNIADIQDAIEKMEEGAE